jgi:uncharacterized protein YcaQ
MQVSREAARRLMIERQGITEPQGGVGKGRVYETVDQLGCVQIDTISVVERAHHLTLWSRLGCHDKGHLGELAYVDRSLFEHWAHALCYIPFKDYRFYASQMERRGEGMRERFTKRTGSGPELIDRVLRRVADEGPLSSSDFEGPRTVDGWGNWKPAKLAMELLYRAGVLLIHHRRSFQKYYDLAENIIPPGVDTSMPEEEERVAFFALRTLSALGLVKPPELRQYYHNQSLRLGTAKQLQGLMDGLASEGEVERHSVEGDKYTHYCLPEDSSRLEELEAGDFGFDDVRMFVYFDNLLWIRERVEGLFGFEPRMEAFLPREQRVYGYYHLPVLYGDRLVARVEPKMDRERGVMVIRGYWLEEGFRPTEDYEDRLQANLDSFARFHGAEDIDWRA